MSDFYVIFIAHCKVKLFWLVVIFVRRKELPFCLPKVDHKTGFENVTCLVSTLYIFLHLHLHYKTIGSNFQPIRMLLFYTWGKPKTPKQLHHLPAPKVTWPRLPNWNTHFNYQIVYKNNYYNYLSYFSNSTKIICPGKTSTPEHGDVSGLKHANQANLSPSCQLQQLHGPQGQPQEILLQRPPTTTHSKRIT